MTGAVASAVGGSGLVSVTIPTSMTAANSSTNGSTFAFRISPSLVSGEFKYLCEGNPEGSTDYWLTNGAPGNYDVRATLTAGALSAGTTGSWTNMATEQSWSCSGAGATLTIEVRDAYTLSVLDSGTLTMTA